MSLQSPNILYGQFDFELLQLGVAKFTRTGINEEALSLYSGTTFAKNKKVADGSKTYWQEGRELIFEVSFKELDTTDLTDIETADEATISFTEPSRTITVDGIDFVVTKIDGLMTKIICKKTVSYGKEWSDIFSITNAMMNLVSSDAFTLKSSDSYFMRAN